MSTLHDIIGSGVTDILSGYTLSQWTLKEYGLAEKYFERQYLTNIEEASRDMSPMIRTSMIRMAMDDVKSKAYSYGTDYFGVSMLNLSNLPYLLFLSLRKLHPNITPEKAESLVNEENEAKLYSEILILQGYKTLAETESKNVALAGKAVNWEVMIDGLRKLNHSYEAIADMTVPQINFEFTRFEKKPEYNHMASQSRNRIFDLVIAHFQISKEQLAGMSIEDIKSRIATVEPKVAERMNDVAVRDAVNNYILDK